MGGVRGDIPITFSEWRTGQRRGTKGRSVTVVPGVLDRIRAHRDREASQFGLERLGTCDREDIGVHVLESVRRRFNGRDSRRHVQTLEILQGEDGKRDDAFVISFGRICISHTHLSTPRALPSSPAPPTTTSILTPSPPPSTVHSCS